MIGSAILGTVGAIGSSALSWLGAKKANNQNQRNWERQFEYTQAMNNLDMQRQDSAIQRAVADGEKAGFSKWDLAGSSAPTGFSTFSSSSGQQNEMSGFEGLGQQIAMMKLQEDSQRASLKAMNKNNDVVDYNLEYAKKNNLPYGVATGVGNLLTNPEGIAGMIGRINEQLPVAGKNVKDLGSSISNAVEKAVDSIKNDLYDSSNGFFGKSGSKGKNAERVKKARDDFEVWKSEHNHFGYTSEQANRDYAWYQNSKSQQGESHYQYRNRR